jgi:hypothetical protein
VEVNKKLFYYLVRNYPIVKSDTPNTNYLKLGSCPYFLHENKKRMRNYLFNELETDVPEHFGTDQDKKEVYFTIKNYIDSARELKNIT